MTQIDPHPVVVQTDLPYPNKKSGKVRDIYDLPAIDPQQASDLLIIATDRLSAFDCILPTPFPGKGQALTAISTRWFEWIQAQGLVSHHLRSTDANGLPNLSDDERHRLQGRIMVCRKAQVIPIECVARGYLAGSGWKEYQQNQQVCGISLPAGLQQCDRLPSPIFTPATKADVGHDENISYERACELVGEPTMSRLRQLTLDIYTAASEYALTRGIIIADTKFEFGYAVDESGNATDELLLIDEALTPDSSRFWPLDEYEAGHDQPSFDKQFVRNHLESMIRDGQWDREPPAPAIPDQTVAATMQRYRQALSLLWA
ncbi:MAG: phosphoribosylaminoimidazolesuccinocarboxamide synthase [Planctomycetes bacterium]|nr:phosphoribosylaminoimidazolesuccinocarboxamide synthase [Planctomycetota bacterium]NOG54098.1 phosphoribosylaminoimidazolesuccinocarboxamide synthase [Planctomycetota bacterium]